MTKAVLTKEELFTAINEVVLLLTNLMLSLDEKDVNRIPYQDSWNAGQLLRHVTKSTNVMAKAMLAEVKTPERNFTEKVPHLKKTFLDFTQKFDSPDFIVPEDENYHKQTAVEELIAAFEKFKENANKTDLNGLVEGLPFGSTTKIELLHFVLYHTERHLNQMQRICESLNKLD